MEWVLGDYFVHQMNELHTQRKNEPFKALLGLYVIDQLRPSDVVEMDRFHWYDAISTMFSYMEDFSEFCIDMWDPNLHPTEGGC